MGSPEKVLAGYDEGAVDLKLTHMELPVSVEQKSVDMIDADGSRICLTIVDTPGFGDNIDNKSAFDKILGYIEFQYDEVLGEESKLRRNPRFNDNRVHVCLYFIDWTGHGLRELDIEMMRQLGRRVNVIPILSRADALTEEERLIAKEMILDDIAQYEIPIYRFPSGPDDDSETVEENEALASLLPFAVVSGTDIVTLPDHTTSIGRIYPWGVIDSMNPAVSDFVALKSALLGSHIHELRELTHDVLYENYRTEKLSGRLETNRGSRVLEAKELAEQAYAIKQAKLAREQENIRDMEFRVQQEIDAKRKELLAREAALRDLEARISREASRANSVASPPMEMGNLASPPQPLHHSLPVAAHSSPQWGSSPVSGTVEEQRRFSATNHGLGVVPEAPNAEMSYSPSPHQLPLSNPPLMVPKERAVSNPISISSPNRAAERPRSFSSSVNRRSSQISAEEYSQNHSSYSETNTTTNGSSPEDSMRQMNVASPYTQGL